MNVFSYIGLRYTGTRNSNQLVAFLSRISILGLIVGVGLLLAVLSIMNGFDRELRLKILGLVPQAAIYQRAGVDDWPALQQMLEAQPGVQAAAPFVQVNALVVVRQTAEPVLLFGIDPEQEMRVSRIQEFLPAGVLSAMLPEAHGLVLGAGIAQKIGAVEGGEVMMVAPNSSQGAAPKVQYFKVLRILQTDTELDNALAITDLASAAALTATPQAVSGMRLRVADLFQARTTAWQALNRLGPGYYGTSWVNTHGNLYHAIQMSKRLVALLMSLIVAIAAFNVISTLIMVVVEKQGDIAILRTLGATTGDIMRIFIVQGCTIGLIGTSLGVLFGLSLSLVVEDVVRVVESVFRVQFLKSDVYPLTYLPTEVLWSDLLLVTGTSLAMSFLATLYPAWRASQVQPAEALRYE